jgi:hypothetical protein
MKEITFKGTVSEAHKKADDWQAAHPHCRIINKGAPITVRHRW